MFPLATWWELKRLDHNKLIVGFFTGIVCIGCKAQYRSLFVVHSSFFCYDCRRLPYYRWMLIHFKVITMSTRTFNVFIDASCRLLLKKRTYHIVFMNYTLVIRSKSSSKEIRYEFTKSVNAAVEIVDKEQRAILIKSLIS